MDAWSNFPGESWLAEICFASGTWRDSGTTILFLPRGVWKISKSAASVGERMLGGAFLSKALVKIVHSSHISINREREEDDRV